MNSRVAEVAGKACKTAEMAQKVVLVVGVLLAIGAVALGASVSEPWGVAGFKATDDWQSILAGIVVALSILAQTAFAYAVLAVGDAKAEEILHAHQGGVVTNPPEGPVMR